MQPPYVDDKVPVFKVPMEDGVLGKANNDKSSNSGFSIHINQNVNNTSALKSVVEHESHHIDQMVRGDLAYDDNNVYWKGKKYSREKMDEGNHDLPWEKEVYNKTKQKKMAFKLRDGAGKQSPFNNLTRRGLTPLYQVEGDDPKLKKSTEVPTEHSANVKKAIKQNQAEGYEIESQTSTPGVRSTTMSLDTAPKKRKVDEKQKPTESKQYAGAYVPRKGLGKVLGKYKTVKSKSAEQAYTAQKAKGRMEGFENVNKGAKKRGT
jgi:hypothetical protein